MLRNRIKEPIQNQPDRFLVYIPAIRQHRKNIPYLKPEEIDAIHGALSRPDSGLCMRDRAIGMLLFFTGIRGCDISCMKFSDIDWEKEEIHITQQKTANGLILPILKVASWSIMTLYQIFMYLFDGAFRQFLLSGSGCNQVFQFKEILIK